MLTYGVVTGVDRMCLPVLFKEISTDLGLNTVSLGTIWGMDPLAGIFVGLPAGLLVDRFGIKRTLTVVCILGGIFCALRGLSINFLTLAASMFLFGSMAAMGQAGDSGRGRGSACARQVAAPSLPREMHGDRT